MEDLWEALYQISLTILLKKFIKLNVNTEMMIKNVKLAELNIKTGTVFLNTFFGKNYQKKFKEVIF